MAIFQNCKSCTVQISAQAEVCPHCKAVLREDKPEPKPKRRDWDRIKGVPGPRFYIPKKHRIAFAVMAAIIGWVIFTHQGQYIQASVQEYGTEWGFTVPSLTVTCRNHRYDGGIVRPHVLAQVKGQDYALNGAALGSGLYADSRTIMKSERWKYDATNELISRALQLCK